MRTAILAIALQFVGAEPPTEFRIFAAGENQTRKGTFLFDADAAKSVMGAYSAHVKTGEPGMMIDLEHQSLDSESRNYDPDARAWCRLEVRAGELWAVDVLWTADGAARLREKRQRFISPAFATDPETNRVTEIINIAITALPATDRLTPLIAASKTRTEKSKMTPEQLAQCAEIMGLGKDAKVEDVLAALGMMMSKINGQQPSGDNDNDPEDQAEAEESIAARQTILRETGAGSTIEALNTIADWKKSHAELASEREKLANERKSMELADRVKLVAELVTLGHEMPATAWAPSADGMPDGKTPAEPWASMKLATLRARVASLRGVKGKLPSAPVAPGSPGGGKAGTQVFDSIVNGQTVQVELTAREVARATEKKLDLQKVADTKARMGMFKKEG